MEASASEKRRVIAVHIQRTGVSSALPRISVSAALVKRSRAAGVPFGHKSLAGRQSVDANCAAGYVGSVVGAIAPKVRNDRQAKFKRYVTYFVRASTTLRQASGSDT